MIEWILLGALGLLAKAGGDSTSGSGSGSRSSTPSPKKPVDHERIRTEWRSQWEPLVDKSKWIPRGLAARIVARFPPPKDAWPSYSLTAFGLSPEARLQKEFAAHNIAFLAKRKAGLSRFFETIEKSPLTDEQMDACICMDDALQIVAAAGSGKTSTMVAKAGYVLEAGLAEPEQIVLLAFNRDAAKELGQRVRTRLSGYDRSANITSETFHEFGRKVIAKATGRKPSVASWVGSPRQEVAMIVAIVDELRQVSPGFGEEWDVFRTVYGRDIGDIEDLSDQREETPGGGVIQTAQGEFVKSQEERMIADWLFYRHVDYGYERPYEHDTATETHGQYRPDFYYPGIELYHEHFALDARGNPPKHFEGDYAGGVAWKRALHERLGTELFETTSHGLRRGADLGLLERALCERGVELRHDPERKGKGPGPISTQELAGLIRTFQQHVKGGGVTSSELHDAIAAGGEGIHAARLLRFVSLYDRIAEKWEQRLRDAGSIDFDDMLLQAISLIQSEQYKSPFKIILADEFQDSSRVRVKLLKSLLARAGDDGHLCVVGDDWQGINRFAGADLSVMTEFSEIFAHSSQLKLTTTFRCPAALCDVSSAFVSANPRQLEKTVQTTNTHEGPALVVTACPSPDRARELLEQELERMHYQASSGRLEMSGGRRIDVLLLGRYNHDEPGLLEQWRGRFKDLLDIRFRTVHRAKGLEADFVMLLNVVEDRLGFPNQSVDDPVLHLAMPRPETFPMAEERRLFYVAMTRARRQLRIYTSTSAPSRFLVEMTKAGHVTIRRDRGARQMGAEVATSARRIRLDKPMGAEELCPTCQTGRMKIRPVRYKAFVGCSRYPDCLTTAPLLSSVPAMGPVAD